MESLFPAFDLIRKFEGCKLTAYRDMVGRLTIGWGTAHDVIPGMTITQEEADQMLMEDCRELGAKIQSALKVEISNNAFCALISFSYNLGFGSFFHSTLLAKINSSSSQDECVAEFLRWNHAGGHVIEGLSRRRQAEAELFAS